MAEQFLIGRARSTTTHVFGRALNSIGTHHFVIDGSSSPKEEITPPEVFLASISACAAHLIERFAKEDSVPLERAEIGIEGIRNAADPSWFLEVNLSVELTGPSQEQADFLVERFTKR
jgi:uncharacterized OsmC-like protein